ncbi:MAG: A/G-specific adenine glycosylase [bacterium]
MNIQKFQTQIFAYAAAHKRDLPWRTPALTPNKKGELDLYGVLVSEVMLQQTQVTRVMQKYPEFLAAFPTLQSLAHTELSDVLRVWQGMGYNRRGKYLWQAARELQAASNKPDLTPAELDALPGIGPATAASIYCFTYDKPIVFIETNIRKVFLFHFFPDREDVHDTELLPYIQKSLNYENPREWYYALMDYGSYLSKMVPNPNRKSKHYVRQAKFEGSDRQIRGRLLREYLAGKKVTQKNERDRTIWNALQAEGLIK